MDEASVAFCEHCGISREKLGRDHVRPGSERLLRVCGGCDATCCPNCWNVRADRCLLCVPFSLPVAAGRSASGLVVASSRVPASRRPASRRPRVPAIARATTLAGVRRGLLAVGYGLVAVLIVTRSPLYLNASAAGPTAPIQSPGVDVPGPLTSSPTAMPEPTSPPTAEPTPKPTPTVEPTPSP